MNEELTPICPLLTIATSGVRPCILGRCAWYTDGACAIVAVTQGLDDIAYKIERS